MKDIKKHICPTCGGNLNVNVERQMYECPYCGGTFDYDYFREENVLGIAAQALTNNEFTSAGSAYDFMLEKEPDNFEALRGKALIEMDITKIDDIRSLDLYSKINYETTYGEIDRAIESSKPGDREYFTTMKDIVDSGHEYIEEKAQHETLSTERFKTIDTLSELVNERDTVFIYSSSRISRKKAVFLTIFSYILCCLILFLGFKYFTRNPYSKAEDLSKYESKDTFVQFLEYEEAQEREEQRQINYNNWEINHPKSYSGLIVILSGATLFFAVAVVILILGGRYINAEITKKHAKADEVTEKMNNCDKSMAELKDRIKQGYNRLCELHAGNE